MKELSIEEKAKRYDEAIERAKAYHNDYTHDIMEDIFPELKESEDDKVRKKLIHLVKKSHEQGGYALHKWESDEMLAWLEKQGDDKVEQKFKIKDWVVFNNKHQSIYQVEKIEDGYYILRHTHGGTFRVCVLHDESLRPWTIQDAKDGDVLACKGELKYSNGIKYERICLFNNLDNAFFTLTKTSNFVEEYDIDVNIDYPYNTVPATKEQKEILFMAMADAGYVFDFEKKELNKIEQKPAWSEEDERMYRGLHNLIYSTSYCDSRKEFSDFLNSLKDRVQIKPQQEWSEDDEKE